MTITIFGVVWLFILFIVFTQKKVKYMVGLTVFSMVFQSASVLVLNVSGVGPQIVTSFAMIVWSVIRSQFTTNYKIRFRRGNTTKRISTLALMGLIVIIFISRSINAKSYSMENFKYMLLIVQLLIYMFCFISLWNIRNRINENDIQQILYGVITFVTVIGIIQLLTTINILPRNIILEMFIYTPDTHSAYYWKEYYPRVFSTFMEPSYCGSFLVGAFYYLIAFGLKDKKTIILSLVVVAEIILSFSSTAYGAFAITGIVYLILSKNKKALKYLIPTGALAVSVLLATGYLNRILNDVIFEKASTGSYVARYYWDLAAQSSYNSAPVFGVGYKNARGSQFLYSVVAQVGISGSICWFFIWIPIIVSEWFNRSNKMLVASGLFLFGVVVALFIGIPDIDFMVFWLALYINALTLGVYGEIRKLNKRAEVEFI